MYGTADVDALGVKAALDVEGQPLDPDAELPDTATTEPEVGAYLRDRFPALEHAPLREARSCRYELTPDTHFIAAPHPAHPSVWLVGGGSGHGFKHGPAMAERLAAALVAGAPLPARFALGERQRSRSLRTAGSGLAIEPAPVHRSTGFHSKVALACAGPAGLRAGPSAVGLAIGHHEPWRKRDDRRPLQSAVPTREDRAGDGCIP